MPKSSFVTRLFRVNMILAFLVGLGILWLYLKRPSESDVTVLWGFSWLRLIVLFSIVLVLCVLIILFVDSLRETWYPNNEATIAWVLGQTSLIWFMFLTVGMIYVFLFTSEHYLGRLALHRESLRPILTWLALLALQGLISILYLRVFNLPMLEVYRSLLVPSLVAFVSMGCILALVVITKIGLTPDPIYWQEAGVPIYLPQILLVTLTAFFIYLLFARFPVHDSSKMEVFIFIALWGIAFLVWTAQKAKPAYNILGPVAPNFQSYPFGDAMLYDVTAQGFLTGKPIPADFWVKPFYSFFLSLLHLVAGQNFNLIVLLQVAVLALIPSFVYLLTRIIDNRLSGIVAAFLIILREHNSIALSNIIQVSHVQLLLSDVFTMGEMVILVLFLLWWLKNPFAHRSVPVAIGGIMGLLILSRGHPILFVPILFLIGFLFLRKYAQLVRESLLKMAAGLLLVMVPWLWHTYDLTGRIALQDISSTFATKDAFVQSYTLSSNTNSESYGEFESQVFRQVIDHPLSVAQFISAHYFHNVVYSYVFLPQSFQIENLQSYVKRLPFWGSWRGSLSAEGWLLLFINLSILALGFGSAWEKAKGLMLVPVIIGAAYNLSVAVTRRSGWRFILPADWITLVFYAIGIAQMIVIVWSILKGSVDEQVDRAIHPDKPVAPNWVERSSVVISLPFLLIALTLVLGHKVFSVFHPTSDANQIAQQYWKAASGTTSANISAIEKLGQQKKATMIYGKALYPVYLAANKGVLNYSWLSFSKKPFDRLVFYVVGTQSAGVVLPLDHAPALFPDGANVVVVGCSDRDGNIDALAVLIARDPPILYTRQPLPDLTCPLPEPR